MKRKIRVLLAALALSLCLGGAAMAAELIPYEFEEYGLTVSLPEDLEVFTLDTPADDPSYALCGLTKEDMDVFLKEGSYCFDAMNRSWEYELTLYVADEADAPAYLDEELAGLYLEDIVRDYEGESVTVTSSGIYHHDQTEFIKLQYIESWDGIDFDNIAYCTVYGGKVFSLSLYDYTGDITYERESLANKVVNSICFSEDLLPEKPYKPSAPAATPAPPVGVVPPQLYVHEESGASFELKSGWREVRKDPKDGTVVFSPASAPEEYMKFFCMDLWSQLDKKEQRRTPRSGMDQDALAAETLAAALGGSADAGDMVKVGEYDYFRYMTKDEIVYIYLKDGKAYTFCFHGNTALQFYNEFLRTIGGAAFPDLTAAEIEEDAARYLRSKYSPGDILFSIFVTVAVYSLPIIIYRYLIRRAPVEKKKARHITILYGILSFLLMRVIIMVLHGDSSGSSVLLWGTLNYFMLSRGRKRRPKINLPEGIWDRPGSAEDPSQPPGEQ